MRVSQAPAEIDQVLHLIGFQILDVIPPAVALGSFRVETAEMTGECFTR